MTLLEMRILAQALGRLTGAVEPRPLDGEAWQADWQAIERLEHTGGRMLWRALGEDGAERKAATRARARLVEMGLVELMGDKAFRLTRNGADAARRVLGLPTYEDSLFAVDFLADKKTDPHRWTGGWVSENSLCGGDPYTPGVAGESRIDPEWAMPFADAVAPALAAFLIRWRRRSHGDGLFLYGLTQAGWDVARERKAAGVAAPQRWLEIVHGPKDHTPITYTESEFLTIAQAYEIGWSDSYHSRESAQPLDARIWHLDPLDAPT